MTSATPSATPQIATPQFAGPEIVTPLRGTYVALRDRQRSPRKKRKYSSDEITVLEKYKDKYRDKMTTNDRQSILQDFILVDIFNFWYEKGEITADISEEEFKTRIQDVSRWIRNNWRSIYKRTDLHSQERKKSRVDVVWWDMKAKVLEEIKRIFLEGGGSGEPTQEYVFKHRTTAAKQVYLGLGVEEQGKIMEMIDKGGDIVPDDVKLRRAKNSGKLAIGKASKKNWTDMGIYTLTFYAYVEQNGKLTVHTHDNIALHSGNTNRKFFHLYENEVNGMQLKLIEYIKSLRPSVTEQSENSRPDLVISTKEGFPWMPPVEEGIDQKKVELEKLFRTYLNEHYKLASGRKKNHVPFNDLIRNQTKFTDVKYVPVDFEWKDPRNMTKEAILEICEHIRQRQETHGASEGFRFKFYVDGKAYHNAEYGARIDDAAAAARSKKQQKNRKAKSTVKRKPGIPKGIRIHEPTQDELAHDPRQGPSISSVERPTHVPQIDPALCGESTSTTIQLTNDAISIPDRISEGAFIDNETMQILKDHGYLRDIHPVNGPTDGPPQYYVPADAIALLSKINSSNANPNDQNVMDVTKKQSSKKGTQVGQNTEKPRRSDRVQKGKGKDEIDNTKMETRSHKRAKKTMTRKG